MSGISTYLDFGFRESWVQLFLREDTSWLYGSNSLGPKQLISFIGWAKDAEILNSKQKCSTLLCQFFSKCIHIDESFVWASLFTNLYYNSELIRVYLNDIDWQTYLSIGSLRNRLISIYGRKYAESTIKHGTNALVNTFAESPLGYQLKLGLVEQQGRMRYIHKLGTDDIHHLVVAYTLYKFKDVTGRNDIFVDELYEKNCNGGPYKLFGISQDALKSKLIELHNTKILDINNMGNPSRIFLKESYTSIDMVRLFML